MEKGLEIEHLDVETAFLQGELEEQVYIQQPEGYVDPHHPDLVCRLKKAIYGLKQSGRVWNVKLGSILNEMGLQRCEYDPCLYHLQRSGAELKMAVFVDDLLVFASSRALIQEVTAELRKRITLRDLGDITRCFNVNVTRDREREEFYLWTNGIA
ncbi:uncharacterized protein LOC103317335 [Nasonia vitripennis]|uniref:Reverse transcriptase Ty1/copia-type domain-containing protein n=1 Tax=Nasonia vitripennis TaxID=7425 RepID=A0A7M7QCF8_NASVI|nr:uncharacterized protein LOC103317335 [Nasonia vitripennis]